MHKSERKRLRAFCNAIYSAIDLAKNDLVQSRHPLTYESLEEAQELCRALSDQFLPTIELDDLIDHLPDMSAEEWDDDYEAQDEDEEGEDGQEVACRTCGKVVAHGCPECDGHCPW